MIFNCMPFVCLNKCFIPFCPFLKDAPCISKIESAKQCFLNGKKEREKKGNNSACHNKLNSIRRNLNLTDMTDSWSGCIVGVLYVCGGGKENIETEELYARKHLDNNKVMENAFIQYFIWVKLNEKQS